MKCKQKFVVTDNHKLLCRRRKRQGGMDTVYQSLEGKGNGCGHLDAGHSCRITIYARQTRADWRVCRFQPNRSNAAISFNYCFSANVPCVSSYLHKCGLQWSICPCNAMWIEGGRYLRTHASVSCSCASCQHHAPPHARKHLMCRTTCCYTLC